MSEHKSEHSTGWVQPLVIDRVHLDGTEDAARAIQTNFRKAWGNVLTRAFDRLERKVINFIHGSGGEAIWTRLELQRLNTAEAIKTFVHHVRHPSGVAQPSDIGLLESVKCSGLDHASFAANRALQQIPAEKRKPEPECSRLKVRIRIAHRTGTALE